MDFGEDLMALFTNMEVNSRENKAIALQDINYKD